MTTIKLKWENDEVLISVNGHTGYGTVGNDIVCAAVSTLAFTMRKAFSKAVFTERADSYEENVANGRLEVKMRVNPEHREVVKAQIEAIFAGFEILAENFPKYVKIVR